MHMWLSNIFHFSSISCIEASLSLNVVLTATPIQKCGLECVCFKCPGFDRRGGGWAPLELTDT